MNKARRGFTLIELVVVMAIAAILAAIAIPNYSAYVTRSKRAAAKTALLEAAQAMERNYTQAGCYDFRDAASCRARSAQSTGAAIASDTFGGAPKDKASYSITVGGFGTGTNAGLQYTLTATPCSATGANCAAGSDAGFADGECGNLTLTNTGARGITGSGSLEKCWQR